MKPLVYLAAPYSGDPVRNTHLAAHEGMELWRVGKVAVLVPHLTLAADLADPQTAAVWYEYDLDQLPHVDAVYRFGGPSAGADREVAWAEAHDVPVFYRRGEVFRWADMWTLHAAAAGGVTKRFVYRSAPTIPRADQNPAGVRLAPTDPRHVHDTDAGGNCRNPACDYNSDAAHNEGMGE